jgi:hypothetical protein
MRAARLTAATAIALAGAIGVGAQAGETVIKRDSRTVVLFPGRLTTVNVAYPDALEFGGATYSGTVKIISSDPKVGGPRPRLSLVKVLSKGSAEGGSVLRVRIRNGNPRETLAARAIVTAITQLPAGS